jgi:hypothetical protein
MLISEGVMKANEIYAVAWADGTIGFRKRIPAGALPIAKGKKEKIKEVIRLHASDNGKFIVGVRLAHLGIINENPVDCLIKFSEYIEKILEREKQKRGRK